MRYILDLGPNCLQRLLKDDASKHRAKVLICFSYRNAHVKTVRATCISYSFSTPKRACGTEKYQNQQTNSWYREEETQYIAVTRQLNATQKPKAMKKTKIRN